MRNVARSRGGPIAWPDGEDLEHIVSFPAIQESLWERLEP
jgi:hypothetical protein